MEGTENMTNMERFYAERANSALDAFNAGRFDECDSLCTELLARPRLPYLWRAQSALLMATRKDNTAVEFAKDALKYYNLMLEDTPDDEYLKENRQEAERLVEYNEAKNKARAEGKDVSEDEDEAEVEGGSGTVEDDANKKSGDADEQMSGEPAGEEEKIPTDEGVPYEIIETAVGSDEMEGIEAEIGVKTNDHGMFSKQWLIMILSSTAEPTLPMPAIDGRDSRATTVVPQTSSQVTAVAKEEQPTIENLEPIKAKDSTGSGSSGEDKADKGSSN
jgi:hypothetical protein